MKRMVLGLALVALLLPAAAAAGGFATVQLSSLPAGTDAGETWAPTMTILRHGRTPLDGLQPSVRIIDDSGTTEQFRATPTGVPGAYVAEVRFPSGGTWRWEIWDGYSQTHTYSPVTIGDGGGSFPTLTVAAAALATIAMAGVALLALRRRGPRPRPALGG